SHPIQYQVPVFQELARMPSLELTVFYAQIPDQAAQGAGFGVSFEWDIPLLDGYDYELMENQSRKSRLDFGGCDTPGIGRRLRSGQFDAVVVNGWVVKTCLQALWACRRSGIPCIVRGEANDLRARAAWKRWLQARLVRQYAAHLYIGQASRRFYQCRGISDSKLFFAPYCIDNDRFAQSLEWSEDDCRDTFNLPNDTTVFMFCGKLEAKKHPTDLIRAAGQAVSRGANLRLLIVGDGVLRQSCEELARDLKVPASFTGFMNQSEIARAYRASHALVLPSDAGETWGLVVNEAMACGRPAIVSDQVGCAEDLVAGQNTGGVYPHGDVTALADVLHHLSTDRDSVKRMGCMARERVQQYSPRLAAEGIRRAVEYCCG
ncbi:MAG: glycosyltransferase family 4 protein, partial [Planctomycetaceae bacterium]